MTHGRLGTVCGNSPSCKREHGSRDSATGEIVRLSIRCKECHEEFYCSRSCREAARDSHRPACLVARHGRQTRHHRSMEATCDFCNRVAPITTVKKCSRCRNATYCSIECHKNDWHRHKSECLRRPEWVVAQEKRRQRQPQHGVRHVVFETCKGKSARTKPRKWRILAAASLVLCSLARFLLRKSSHIDTSLTLAMYLNHVSSAPAEYSSAPQLYRTNSLRTKTQQLQEEMKT